MWEQKKMFPERELDELLLGFPLRLWQTENIAIPYDSSFFLKEIIVENNCSIFSRSYCEMHLRKKDFSMVDDLCLIVIRHQSDFLKKCSTFINNFEAMSKAKLMIPNVLAPGLSTNHQSSRFSLEWEVILVIIILLIKDFFLKTSSS